MKRIGIDARLYFQTGVGVYLRNLLFYLNELISSNWLIYVYLKKKDIQLVNFNNKNFIKKEADFHWHSFEEQIGFIRLLNQDNLDLVHFTYFSYPIFYKKKFISTIHDLTPLIFKTGKASTGNPLLYQIKHLFLRLVMNCQIRNAITIITPTKSIKTQIVSYYGKKYRDKIVPIYEGVNREIEAVKENFNLDMKFKKKYFIYVGNFYPHKNVDRLVTAFSKIKKDCRLILLGPDDFFSKRIFQLINQLKQNHRIFLFANPSNNDLKYFYNHAQALINPSISEGFSLPLVEAAYFNLPILASNIDVFKEVLGDRYTAFNPYDVDDIAVKISNFSETSQKSNYQGLLQKYSFQKMAEETVEIYKKVLYRSVKCML